MTWNLFIDDERNLEDVTWAPWQIREKYRSEEWEIARTIRDVRLLIVAYGELPSFISFDHDLGFGEYTGHDIAKFIVECDMLSECMIPDSFDFYVHSKNPVGKKNIEAYISGYLKTKDTK